MAKDTTREVRIPFKDRNGHTITTATVAPSSPPPKLPSTTNYQDKKFRRIEGWIKEIRDNPEIQRAIEHLEGGKKLLIQLTPEGILNDLLYNYPDNSTIGKFAHHLNSSLEILSGVNRHLRKEEFLRESRIVLTQIFLGGLQRTT